MSVALNSGGNSAADSIVQGAPFEWVIRCETMDAATVNGAWIDTVAGFPGTNSVLGSLSPASSITTRGTSAAYTHSTRTLNIGSSTGLAAGDKIWVNHGSITPGLVEIESIPSGSSVVLLASSNLFTADATNISFQVAWRYLAIAGTAPSVSNGAGQINHLKAQLSDSAGNAVQQSESHYVKNLPAGALLAAISGIAFNGGGTTNDNTPTLSILNAFGTNNGGVTHVHLANHGSQGVLNATWGDASTTEKTFANAVSLGLTLTGADGIKYGRMVLRTKAGSSNSVTNIDFAITLDSTGPTITFAVYGR
jgi:hypothetical protein